MKGLLIALISLLVVYKPLAGQRITGAPVPSYQGTKPIISRLENYEAMVQADSNQRLIDLSHFVPGVKLDIRYASTHNFMKARMYPFSRAYLRLPAAKALKRVSEELSKQGLGLWIYDAYRPYSITVKFYTLVKDTQFVASPRTGSRHNRGSAVDLGLYDLKTGAILEMPTEFDSFSAQSASAYPNVSERAKADRALLADAMHRNGFQVLQSEWWHFDFAKWKDFDLLDVSFENLENSPTE